ncbi:MAG: hypothetical protein VB047_03835 [Anaerotignum propionicum]|uniref:hypothetical protein n=1 Tax=Anaerotignum propionicum TaxID=28446 RepID=UPI002B2182FA|nr:hypothetical protein [Anaerotignum propionicum]MEA5056670.1 hypothetical protein [Anaerotignum propionicum]
MRLQRKAPIFKLFWKSYQRAELQQLDNINIFSIFVPDLSICNPQTELVRLLQLEGVEITRETLVKIERGIQHIQATQLRAMRDALNTTYDELLK